MINETITLCHRERRLSDGPISCQSYPFKENKKMLLLIKSTKVWQVHQSLFPVIQFRSLHVLRTYET